MQSKNLFSSGLIGAIFGTESGRSRRTYDAYRAVCLCDDARRNAAEEPAQPRGAARSHDDPVDLVRARVIEKHIRRLVSFSDVIAHAFGRQPERRGPVPQGHQSRHVLGARDFSGGLLGEELRAHDAHHGDPHPGLGGERPAHGIAHGIRERLVLPFDIDRNEKMG